jgi:hypothetical protein
MRILFTKSRYPLSKVILAVTKEPVSHCAISYGPWVIHSNLRGVHVELCTSFEKTSEIVFSVPVRDNWPATLRALSTSEFRPYDIGALLYLGLRYLCPWLPKKNLWQSSGMFLCTEWVTAVLDGTPDSMITPYGLYLRLKEKEKSDG